jgi:hypothetical protein
MRRSLTLLINSICIRAGPKAETRNKVCRSGTKGFYLDEPP